MTLLAAALLTLLPCALAQNQAQVPPRNEPPLPPMHGVAHAGEQERQSATAQVYTIGDVSPDEQLYVELINRARANPAAELQLALQNKDVMDNIKFFGTNTLTLADKTNALITAFALLPSLPPVALSSKLTVAARRHVLDMKNNVGQNHVGSDGTQPSDRVGLAGYSGAIGENIYSAADYTEQGHWAFDVDWGRTVSGIQSPPGHRNTIHGAQYKEVGVGVAYGSGVVAGWNIGPQLVVQEFGVQPNSPGFLTGVVYYDHNKNNFYDVSEGVGNATVTIMGTNSRAITSISGGYSLPLPDGNYTAIIRIPGGLSKTNNYAIQNRTNVKLDFPAPYTAPVVTDNSVPIGAPAKVTFSSVPGAIAYKVRQFEIVPPAPETAENASATTTFSTTPDYDVVINSNLNGTKAFHLATIIQAGNFLPPPQIVRLNAIYLATADTKLEFDSRVGSATDEQVARVEVSIDGGTKWEAVWTQAGASIGGDFVVPGEVLLNPRTVDLGRFAGNILNIRFVWDVNFNRGFVVDGSLPSVGWSFDNILVKQGSEVINEIIRQAFTNFVEIVATAETSFGFQISPIISSEPLPFGPLKFVQAVFPPALVRVTSVTHVSAKEFLLNFTLEAGKQPASFTVEKRGALGQSWAPDNNARVTALDPSGSNQFSARVIGGRADTQSYYRIKVIP